MQYPALVAQMVEQGIEDPRVGGSTPSHRTIIALGRVSSDGRAAAL